VKQPERQISPHTGGFFGWMLRLRCAIKGRHLFVPTKNCDLALICYYCDEVSSRKANEDNN